MPKAYAQDGYIDILKPETLYRKKSMGGDKIMGYFGHDEAYDIDNIKQLNEIRNIAKNKYINLQDKVQFNILRFGTLQGRLTDSRNKLQFFPEEWEKEFFQANKLNLKSIEWLIERENSYINNPIIDKNKLYYLKKIIEESKVSIASVCTDFIINKGLVIDLLKTIIQNLYLLDGEKLILPLMGNSELTEKNIDTLSQKIRNIAKFAEDFSIEISIESDKDPEIIKKLINMINLNNVGICFDLGNRNTLSNDVVKELEMLFPHINHIHIKDKNKEGNNVLLGEGSTKFHEILKVLYINNYSNSLVFESIRSKDAISNMNENIKFITEKLEVIECQ
ncbi:sugar phosphate isomerase/epimerase family protein [Staphylococcus saprophyticus]